MGIKLRCPNKECNNEWEYNGKSKFYACCSDCRTTVNIKKHTITEFSEDKKEGEDED